MITDFESLSVEEAIKKFLDKYPNKMIQYLTLRKALYPGVYVPGYYMTTPSGENYLVDFDGNVGPVN